MTEQFILSVISSVGVPAATLFFILYIVNKNAPVLIDAVKGILAQLTLIRETLEYLCHNPKGGPQ